MPPQDANPTPSFGGFGVTNTNVRNGFDIVLFTMTPDGSDKRVLVRYRLNPERMEATHGEQWPLGLEWPATPTPVSNALSTNGLMDAPSPVQVPPATGAPAAVSVSVPVPARTTRSSTDAPSPVQPPTATGLPVQAQNVSETPACTGDSDDRCAPRDISRFDPFSAGTGGAAYGDGRASTVEEVLEKGLHLMEASPAHIAVRGTAREDSVRCDWHGVARTAQQREEAIRFWLGKDDSEPLPSAAEVEAEFMAYINRMAPRYQDSVAASFLPIARGGLSTEHLTLTCYADYDIHEYLLGNGTSTLSVAYDDLGRAGSYDLYSRGHAAGEFGNPTSTPLMSEAEHQDYVDQMVWDAESSLAEMVEGSEGVLFLAPMGAHNAIAVEVWQAVAQWDLQLDDDATVNAVRYGAPSHDPEYSQPLTELEERVETAAETDEFAGERIESAEDLTEHYEEIGAYDDITPDDGETTTFTPEPPPPVPPCYNAVDDPRLTPGLVSDCAVLLDVKDTLAGTATLDWNSATAITEWEGITVDGDPSRVVSLELPSKGLDGSLPSGLSGLRGLQVLALSSNSLTGTIPTEIGGIADLQRLDLSSNQIDGEIPPELGNLSKLQQLRLKTNQLSGQIPPELTALSSLEILRLGGNQLTGCIPSALQDVGDNDLTVLDLPYCIPAFESEGYTFSVQDDVPVTTVVGTVTATDLDSDPVTYAITGGNEDGKFAIDELSGEIAVADLLNYVTSTSYSLAVEASDPYEGVSTVTVDISVFAPCANGVAVPNPGDNPGLVGDCTALLEIRDALAGTATLDWSADTAITEWSGITVEGTPGRVRGLAVSEAGLSGQIPSGLSGLSELATLDLRANQLTGEIPLELRDLGSLAELYVSGNDLTGCIPSALQDVAQNDLDQLSLPYCVPAFETDGYSFSVQRDAAVDTVVGAVTATDADGDTVTYAITGGNEEGKFAIGDGSSGQITVADLLDYDTVSSYSLTVEATDGYGTAVSTVAISLIGDCSVGIVVSDPEANSDLVEDCELLLHIRDTLAGTATLNWSVDTPITDWDGITVGGTPSRVLRLSLISRGLTGTIPPTLAELTGLEVLALNRNELTGPIPAELARLSNLSFLSLAINQLSGEIPAGLGNLANLKQLWLKDNQLTGEIPPELGSLSKLTYLVLHTNQLSGDIPAWLGLLTNLEPLSLESNQLSGEIPPELAELANLTYLGLSTNQLRGDIPAWLGLLTNLETLGLAGNQLTGCIPSTLQEVETNDLGDLALPYCAPVFDSASYSFLASEDADVGDVVGTVSATDSDGDIPTYSITGGDDDGKFAMVASTGAITVAGTLDRSDASSYSLTRIHRRTALGTALEEASGCSSESGIMVLEQKPARKQGAPNRCCHRTTPTVSASSLTTIAWWPMPACSCRPL